MTETIARTGVFLLLASSVALALAVWLRPDFRSQVQSWLKARTELLDRLPDKHIGLWIALAAGAGLYAELMLIRTHASYFQLFAYFKNVSLLSCFLGLGVGYSRGEKTPVGAALALPLLALQIALMFFLRNSGLADYLQNPVSEQLTLGMRQAGAMAEMLTAYGFLAAVFVFNAAAFVPLGHLASRLMLRKPGLVSYGWNLAGSLGGIALFSALSFAWTGPPVWVAVLGICLVPFFMASPRTLAATAIATLALVALLASWSPPGGFEVHSPYQVLSLVFKNQPPPVLQVNNVYYQHIIDLGEEATGDEAEQARWRQHYSLPYTFAAERPEVLIVGSGTGNDVAAAVRNGSARVDAVEIDPAILEMGKRHHPESPYQAPNVFAHVADAREFMRNADRKWDLVVYGLLDSHTLLSGMSGVRLDSYVYTVEAFRAARKRLKPGGALVLSFCILRIELAKKLYGMLKEAFDGASPSVYLTGYDKGYAFVIAEDEHAIAGRKGEGLEEVTQRFGESSVQVDLSTDDWPFLYMPHRTYPVSYVIMLLVLLTLSAGFIRFWRVGGAGSFSFPCFFLGAGFMLVETKGITEMALVSGSTWMVISIVIAAILVMAFLANLAVIKGLVPPRPVTYGLLVAAVLAGMFLSGQLPDLVPTWAAPLAMMVMLTIPLFFSGFAFSFELKRCGSVPAALSANLLGSMLGGFLEYNSMYFGFKSLYLAAVVMYAAAFLTSLLGSRSK